MFSAVFCFVACDKDVNTDPKQPENPDPELPEDTIVFKCNGFPELCDRNIADVSLLMTHNAYNNAQKNFLLPNQDFSIARQLRDGVRGLMLDVYSSANGPVLYHGVAQTGKEPLKSVLTDIYKFMSENKNEVVVIIFENACTDEEIMDMVDSVGLAPMVYHHTGTWPTLRQMIESNQRLVLTVEQTDGDLPDGLLYAWEHTFDTPYTFANWSDFTCAVNRGGSGKKTFFLLNHWMSNAVGLPDKTRAKRANSWEMLGQRVNDCSAFHNRRINFVGVDFYNLGDALAIVDSLNGVRR